MGSVLTTLPFENQCAMSLRSTVQREYAGIGDFGPYWLGPLVFLAPSNFSICRLSMFCSCIFSVRIEDYSTNTLCSLHLISTFLVHQLLPSLGVRRLSSVNFSHFKLLLRNHLANWNQT